MLFLSGYEDVTSISQENGSHMTQARSSIVHLASRSPRRRELLRQLGVDHEVVAADVPEIREPGETPAAYVERVAIAKAVAGRALVKGDAPVLGADTDVILDDVVLGKPADREAGLGMLRALAGRSHEVLSAVALTDGTRTECRLKASRVTFAELDDETIEAYWATGEPAGKAGAYAVQGLGAAFVTHLEGSYSAVMGLPLHETALLLKSFGIDPLANPPS